MTDAGRVNRRPEGYELIVSLATGHRRLGITRARRISAFFPNFGSASANSGRFALRTHLPVFNLIYTFIGVRPAYEAAIRGRRRFASGVCIS